MSKSMRRRPELERLEAVVLLATAAVAPMPPAGPVALSGTFHLSAKSTPAVKGLSVATPVEVGNGSLAKFGRTAMVFELVPNGSPSPTTIIGLTNHRGYVALSTGLALPAKGASVTGAYAEFDGHDGPLLYQIKPTGTITITEVPLRSGKPSYSVKLS